MSYTATIMCNGRIVDYGYFDSEESAIEWASYREESMYELELDNPDAYDPDDPAAYINSWPKTVNFEYGLPVSI